VKLSVIMPVLNEIGTIREIVRRVLAAPVEELEVVVVDDGSTDGTREVLQELAASEPRLKLVLHERRQGKGAGVRTGLRHATGEVVIIQDADLEYHPDDYALLLKPIVRGDADAVFGSRFLGPHRAFGLLHYLGNKIITWLFNLLYNVVLTDVQSGYKCFRRELIAPEELEARGFGIDVELAARLCRAGARVFEAPIYYAGRGYAEGKKLRWHDALPALWAMVKWRWRPFPRPAARQSEERT
jgi:glycosyltransferase involved in cell wall biosynthesis